MAAVDPQDVRRKVLQQLIKQGYSETAAAGAYDVTEEQAEACEDLQHAFNQAKRLRFARVWEVLQKDPEANAPEPRAAPTQPAPAAKPKLALRMKASRVVWNPDVTYDADTMHTIRASSDEGNVKNTKKGATKTILADSKAEEDQGMDYPTPSASAELLRWRHSKKLRQLIFKACKSERLEVPLLVYERWLARSTVSQREEQGAALQDALLPSTPAKCFDKGLVKDLERGGMRVETATETARELAQTCNTCISEVVKHAKSVNPASEPCVHATSTKVMVILALGEEGAKPYMEVNKTHYTKLLEMYRRGKAASAQGEVDYTEFHTHLWCLLTRYASLQGHGYQAALTNKGFDVLLRKMGVKMECFASPLNCRYSRFCSAFPDTDAAFGSLGSFFDFWPTTGSFEANPPFVPEVMLRMVAHIDELLARSSEPLSFTVLVPNWTSVAAIQQLEESKWKQGSFVIKAGDHTFCDGAQHQHNTSERFRPSSFDTLVVILQNQRGSATWPVSDDLENELRYAVVSDTNTGGMSIPEWEDNVRVRTTKGKPSESTHPSELDEPVGSESNASGHKRKPVDDANPNPIKTKKIGRTRLPKE